MISCILLSAGSSKRFGSPKALASFMQTTVIDRIQSLLLASKIDEIVIVLGDHYEEIKPHILKHKTIKVVYNKDYKFGQTSSFKAGLGIASSTSEGFMLFPVDFPLIQPKTIDALVDHFQKKKPFILIPRTNNKKGHPPIFNKSAKNQLLELDNNTGINTFEREHEASVELLSVDDEGILKSFNTQKELEDLKACL